MLKCEASCLNVLLWDQVGEIVLLSRSFDILE